MPPGGEGSPRAALPSRGRKRWCRQQSPARPRGTPGRGPASGCCWQWEAGGGDSCTWGGKFRWVFGLGPRKGGSGPRRKGLCVPAGLGRGRLEMEGWPGTTTHLLPGPGSAWNESPCLTLEVALCQNLPVWCPRRGGLALASNLKSHCSPSDKGFLAYLLMASCNSPPVPLHPLPSGNIFMECLGPNECVERNGGEALLGELGSIWGSLKMLHKATFFVFRLSGVLP